MNRLRTSLLLMSVLVLIFGGLRQVKAVDIMTNGSFEAGDFTGWGTKDIAVPFYPLHVRVAGTSPEDGFYGFFLAAPTDGSFAATHGFDGGGPDTIEIFQDVAIPAGHSAILTFDWRAGWDFTLGFPYNVRTLDLVVEPAGDGSPLSTTNILSVEGVCLAEDPNEDPNDPNEARYVSIPLALWSGDDKVLTEAFLKCRVRRYSLSVSEFVTTAREPEEKTLSRLFRFIQDENRDSLPDDLLASDAGQKTRETALKVRKMVGEFLSDATIISMVHIGQYRLFIVGVADPRFAFVRHGDKEGRYYFFLGRRDNGWRWILGKNKSMWCNMLIHVIWDSYVHAMRTDVTFSECREDLRFEYALPSTTKGSPVYLQFKGRGVDVDVFADDSSVPTNDSVMQFYVKAWRAFQEAPIEWFPGYWDQRSRAKINKFLGKMTGEEMARFNDQMVSGGRHAWLVLEATPLSVVFVHSSAPMIKRFDYVREKPESDGLQLCGYNRMGFGEQFLASKEIGQILKKAAGTMEKP